jgi:YidC/Oxa1 family membrane protein insertase
MDRKTILAVVISVVIIVGSMILQPVLFPPKPVAPGTTQSSVPKPAATESGQGAQVTPAATPQPAEAQVPTQAPAAAPGAQTLTGPGKVVPLPESAPPTSQPRTIERETDLYTLTFSSSGATLSSVKLKKYKNLDGTLVEMELLPKTETAGTLPFAIAFGDYKAEQVAVPFTLAERSDSKQSTFDFSRTFLSPTGVPFTLHKTYLFDKDEYLFELRVTIENSVNDFPALDFGGFAYTLTMGPQIGPTYKKLDNTHDFRNYAFYADGKRQDPKVGMGQVKELDKHVTWAGIVGKYFTAIAVLDATNYSLVYDSRKIADGFDHSAISFQRPVLKSAKTTDTYRFYMGPMKKEILANYNDSARNAFGISGLHADEVVTSSPLIGWLATLMKYVLDFFYILIPNYGIAIILLTILTKVVFLPLTFKSSESMAKMATLNPKMTEIRARLKDKPDKMNQEIAELYKREKINPLSGCLPLLLQMPIFFALYNLLQSHFELRGALFIPGWITDLSAPESILTFPFAIPLVGWTALRLLPLLMVASQILSSKFTQPSGAPQQGGGQAKLFAYALPIVFLFILYDMASGLVLYWTVQNILSTAQQVYINRLRKKKEEAAGQIPVIVKASVKTSEKSGVRTGK